jgi:hypothetical protein
VQQFEEMLATEARIQKRRKASIASSTKSHNELWRQKRLRVGNKWVLQTKSTPAQELPSA